jgi:hypothetical protein
MKKIALVFVSAVIAGCAAFTQPVYNSAEAEQEECLESPVCKFLFDSRPAWVYRYSSQMEDCKAHATDIVRQAREDGRLAGYVVGDMAGTWHAVAYVEDQGEAWIFDNGRISKQPFHSSELEHWMKWRKWSHDL